MSVSLTEFYITQKDNFKFNLLKLKKMFTHETQNYHYLIISPAKTDFKQPNKLFSQKKVFLLLLMTSFCIV